jgi:hypothetical protein
LRGLGAAAAKSAELLPVSTHPSPFLTSALVALGAGARAVSKQFVVEPYPTRSRTAGAEGQAPESAATPLTSATLPAVALMAIEPEASCDGRGLTPLTPPASPTR